MHWSLLLKTNCNLIVSCGLIWVRVTDSFAVSTTALLIFSSAVTSPEIAQTVEP